MGWDHGYNTETPYTCGFYRELVPDWLDFAALLRGQPSPRTNAAEPFRYLELGSGMGFGLCLIAAAYPEGRFTGIDFKPDHILHSRRLAAELRLTNVEFHEGDFLSLAQEPGDLKGAHHYVVAHGIATWITESVQQAMLSLAGEVLLPGGLFYCSYNTTPGWLSSVPLQQLAWQLLSSGVPAADAVRQAASKLTELLGTEEAPSALALAQPGLKQRLAQIANLETSYLIQEYLNEGWQPIPVSVLHSRALACKLQYVASASLPENFEVLLPESVQAPVLAEPDLARRQTLLDLAINQSFRRDVLVRGRLGLTAAEQTAALGQLSLRLLEAPPQDAYQFTTSLGTVNGRADLYQALEKLLVAGPVRFSELQLALNLDLAGMAQVVSLSLHAGRLALDRGVAGERAREDASRVNRSLRVLQCQGRPYRHQVAPLAGTAVPFGLAEALLLDNPDPAALPAALDAFGQRLNGDPAPVAETFRARLARLQALGVV